MNILDDIRGAGLDARLKLDGKIHVTGPADVRDRLRNAIRDRRDELVALLRCEASGVDLCSAPGCYEVAIWFPTAKVGDTWCDDHRPDNLTDLPRLNDWPPHEEVDGRIIWEKGVLDWGWGSNYYRPLPFPEPDEDGYPVLPAFVEDDGTTQAWCIYCAAWHHHGGGSGHRIAHCSHPESPYTQTGYVLRQVGLVCRVYDRCDEIAGGIGHLSGLPLCAEHWHEECFADEADAV